MMDETPLSFKTIDEAEAYKRQLISEIQDIERQLTARKSWSGEELSYIEWRKRAISARNHRLETLRKVKTWIKDEHRKQLNERLTPEGLGDTEQLLLRAFNVLKVVASETDITPEEQAVIDAIEHHLRGIKRTA